MEQAITWNACPKELIRRYGRFRNSPLGMFSGLRVKVPAQPDGGEGLVMMQGLPPRVGV